MWQCHQPPRCPSPWLPELAAAPGAESVLVSAAFSLRKTPPRAGDLGTRAATRPRHLRPSFVPAQSKAPSQPLPPHPLRCAGVRGVVEGQNPLPALSQGGKPPAQRCHRPCRIQQAPQLRDGEKLSRALPPCTERRDFGARKAVADPPPSRPSPPTAHPSGRQECVAGTARLPPPAEFLLLIPLPGPPGLPERSVSGKGAPSPGAVQREQGHQGPPECRERRLRPGKGEKCFREKSGVAFACVPSPTHPAELGSHLAPYAPMTWDCGIKIPLVDSAVKTLQKIHPSSQRAEPPNSPGEGDCA